MAKFKSGFEGECRPYTRAELIRIALDVKNKAAVAAVQQNLPKGVHSLGAALLTALGTIPRRG